MLIAGIVVGAVLLIAVALVALHRLLLRLERKGWIYYRKMTPGSAIGGAMGVFQELAQPEIRHVIEAEDQRKAEIDQADPSRR